jgi:hypothetical protein
VPDTRLPRGRQQHLRHRDHAPRRRGVDRSRLPYEAARRLRRRRQGTQFRADRRRRRPRRHRRQPRPSTRAGSELGDRCRSAVSE